MSPLTPVPEMTGSVVVVSVLPLAGLAMVGAAGAVGTATVKVSVAAVELGPPEAACVAVTVWLALLNGEVGVKLQAPLTTSAVPTCVPSIETVTVSPLTPVPAMAGSAVVVSVLPLAGLAMVGAAGAVGTATVKVSVAAVELGPPEAACVAVTVWLALLSGEVGVKLQAPLTTAPCPTCVPSIETVTVSPLTPVPAMTGSAVVVSVLPLAGLAMVGAAGAVGTATVKVSVAAVELGPPEAACVAVTVWLALLSGEVGVKLQALLTTAPFRPRSVDRDGDRVAADAGPGDDRLGRRRVGAAAGRAGDGRRRRGGRHGDGEGVGGGGRAGPAGSGLRRGDRVAGVAQGRGRREAPGAVEHQRRVPTCVPSIETVTVSPLTPVPAIAGSAVVVSVLPLAGLAMVGAAGAVGTATVKVSVAAVELGPPAAACVAETVWLALLSGEVGVKLQAPLTTGAVPALRSVDRDGDRVAADPGPGDRRLGRRRVGAAVGRAGDGRRRRGGRHGDGEGVGGGGRAGPAGSGLGRGDRVAGVAQRRGRREAPGAVDHRGRADRSVDRDGDRVAADPGPGDGRLGRRRVGAAVGRAGDGRRRRGGRHGDGEGVGGGGRAGPAGGGLGRGDRVAGVAQGRGRREAPGAVDHRGRARTWFRRSRR